MNAQNRLNNKNMDVKVKSDLIKILDAKDWQPRTLAVMKDEMIEMKRKEEVSNSTANHLMIRLKEQVSEMVRLRIETLLLQCNEKRINRANQRIAHLTDFARICSDVIMNAEIMWILMQFDMERIKKRHDFDPVLEKYRNEAVACNRRIVRSFLLS